MADAREQQLQVPTSATKAVFDTVGGPVKFVTYDPSSVELQPGQVLVRVTYTGVCHTYVSRLLPARPAGRRRPARRPCCSTDLNTAC